MVKYLGTAALDICISRVGTHTYDLTRGYLQYIQPRPDYSMPNVEF